MSFCFDIEVWSAQLLTKSDWTYIASMVSWNCISRSDLFNNHTMFYEICHITFLLIILSLSSPFAVKTDSHGKVPILWSYSHIQALLKKIDNTKLVYKVFNLIDKACSQIRSSPGYTLHPPVQIYMAESSDKDRNGEQTSSEEAQRQFLIAGRPPNLSFPPMQNFHFLPSQAHASPVNYGEGFENDPNIPSSQLEAYRKLLQCQIQVMCALFSLPTQSVMTDVCHFTWI